MGVEMIAGTTNEFGNKKYERLTQPLKWAGGKHYLAKKLIALMPPHIHYVEPFAGGLAVLLEKDQFDLATNWGEKGFEQGTSEVVNDLHRLLTNFWRVLQDTEAFAKFQRVVEAMPFSQIEWDEAESRQNPVKDRDVDAAVAFFVRCRQSRSGECKQFTSLTRNRTRRNMNAEASAWWNAVEGLPAVSARLRNVVITNEPAIKVIQREDGPRTLFYCDPPYLHSTRTSTDLYEHEMTEDDHRELLKVIKACRGMVMISGYPNDLYDEELGGWRRVVFPTANSAAGGKTKRIMSETEWMNFQPTETQQVCDDGTQDAEMCDDSDMMLVGGGG